MKIYSQHGAIKISNPRYKTSFVSESVTTFKLFIFNIKIIKLWLYLFWIYEIKKCFTHFLNLIKSNFSFCLSKKFDYLSNLNIEYMTFVPDFLGFILQVKSVNN